MRLARWKLWIRSPPPLIWIVWLLVLALHLFQLDVTWFSIDQTRDVLQATDIASGRRFPLIGPQMHWIAHIGPLYYYFLALPFVFVTHPYAAYVFLAVQATITVACGYYFLRRYFSANAARLFLVLFAPSTFVLMDSRGLWTPAFLPFWSVLSLWAAAMLFWENRQGGLVALAAIVGTAVQFHLSFVLIVPVSLAGYLIHRPRIRLSTLLLALVVGILTHAPYLYYQASHEWVDIRAFLTFAHQAGGAAGPAVPLPLVQRLFNYLIIPYHLSEDWLRLTGMWLSVFRGIAVLSSFLLITSTVGMLFQAVYRYAQQPQHAARRLFLLVWFALLLAALLVRGEDLYYYYFDLLLPLPFLIPAIFLDDTFGLVANAIIRRRAILLGFVLLVPYTIVQAGAFFRWSSRTAQNGLFELTPEQLDLHKFQSASPLPHAQFMPLRSKVQLARTLVEDKGWSREESYRKVFGSRFYDATEERGFWLGYFKPPDSKAPAEKPVVLWHLSDPLEKWAGEMDIPVAKVGAFRLAELALDALPHPWLRENGTEIHMPVRIVPELREYGFVAETPWPPGPVQLRSRLQLKSRPQGYLLVIITKGEKLSPRLLVNGGACGASERNETLMTAETFFRLDQELVPGENQLELQLDHERNFDLDVFAWAKW